MRAIVFSTHRQIRDFIAEQDDAILPKLYTIDEFIRRCVVVEGRVMVDDATRVIHLYKAVQSIDIDKLGFEKNFLSFLQNSTFIFRFFEELFAEKVTIEDIRLADIYADFEDHLALLERIYENYKKVLDSEGLFDRITIENYRLCENFLRQFERIDFYVEGYLSRFEVGVLGKIGTPLFLHLTATPFNRKLLERLPTKEPLESGFSYTIDWHSGEAVSREKCAALEPEKIHVAAFEERIDQVGFVLKMVDEFIEKGADPDRVAVIVPDEGFCEYLKLFDKMKNFNFAMGTPFVQTRYYRTLSDLYEALTDGKASAKAKMANSATMESFAKVNDFEGFLEFLKSLPLGPREEEAIDEELFMFRRFAPLLEKETPLHLLKSWLRRIERVQIDDIGGGRVTVMGVLESRGKRFDGAVIVDFNEDTVPKVSEKDLFLNSSVRKHAKMPTREEKENLQKNYYYRLLQNSDRVAIGYVKNEENQPSRFLLELGLSEASALEDDRYRPIIAPVRETPRRYDAPIVGKNPFLAKPKLTPSRLKDYFVCKRRFYYKYILSIRQKDKKEEPNIGTLVHDALESAAKNKDSFGDWKGYHSFVMNHIYKNAASPLQRFEISIEFEPRLENFCKIDFDSLKGYQQARLEEWCPVEFGGFLLNFRIDRVDVGETIVRLIDYKTTRSIESTIKDENDYQLLFYRLWAEKVWPDRKIVTLFWDIYKGEEIAIETEEAKEELAKRLENLKVEPEISYDMTEDIKACRYCDYRVVCGRDG